MRVGVLVVSRNRPDLVRDLAGWLERNLTLDHDLIVVEAGTDPDKVTPWSTVRYDDDDFRGKCFAHARALEEARRVARERGVSHDYYWVLMNDLVFPEGVDACRALVETMEREPRLGILSPTCEDGLYPGSRRRDGGGWRPVTTCDYLGFLIRARAVDGAGFLDPEFRWCWGAIHDLSYRLYSRGWLVAYSDDVTYRHLGGTTYGAPGTNTVSREEYQANAKRFAARWFLEHHGPDWDREFWRVAREATGDAIEIDTYARHRALWESVPTPEERTMDRPATQPDPSSFPRPLKLHLGSGGDPHEGWLNVDVNPNKRPDLVASATSLPMLEDGCAAAIESYHLFEHLTLAQARAALAEWRRLLAPGGELALELPNLERCVQLLGTEMGGFDLGLISLFGYPPEVDAEGEPQLHKWGWTPATLSEELARAGFVGVEVRPVVQTWRPAARFDRDMRLVARAPQPVVATPQPEAATEEERRIVFAWPRYEDRDALDTFFHVFARVLTDREDVTLWLRRDPACDPEEGQLIARLADAHARVLGADTPLDVALHDAPLDEAGWRALGERVACRVRTGHEAPPRDGVRHMPTPVVADAKSLFTVLAHGAPQAAAEGATASEETVVTLPGVRRDPALVARLEALHPWFYPVEIDGHRVVPGVGSVCAADWLESRAAHRATLLAQGVLQRIDFRNKSVLDLACNCGYWSARYAGAGAVRVVGVEGRDRHVEQARLYWERGAFLPQDGVTFLQGNVSDEHTWERLALLGPYDVTLCAGILYHVPDYAEVLRKAARLTRDVLIVDTRVTDGDEVVVREPGDLTFNAIAETRDKVVPNRARLLAVLRELGMEPEVLPVGFGRELGVDDVDCYADGRRVTIVARKVRSAVAGARR